MFPSDHLLHAIIAQTTEGEGGSILSNYLAQGGWMMYVILTVSLVGTLVFLERTFSLFILRRLNARVFIDTLVGHIEQNRFRQALDSAQISSRHPLIAVTKAGILRANRREKEIERAMENEMLAALPQVQKGVAFLALLANICTLLGLLGTIFGLIVAFSGVASADAAERQQVLASGISQAMYTTAFGISAAVPLLFFHHILSKRLERMMIEVEGGASALLVALTGARHSGKAGAGASGGPAPSGLKDGSQNSAMLQ